MFSQHDADMQARDSALYNIQQMIPLIAAGKWRACYRMAWHLAALVFYSALAEERRATQN